MGARTKNGSRRSRGEVRKGLSGYEKQVASLPPAIPPAYRMTGPNENIVLFEGELELRGKRKGRVVRPGRIYLRWLPEPRIEFEVQGGVIVDLQRHDGGTLKLKGRSWKVPFLITSQSAKLGDGPGHLVTRGILQGDVGGFLPRVRRREVSSIVFHVPNGEWLHGDWVREDGGSRAARTLLEAQGWRVTLDSVENHKDVRKDLSAAGGFAITHLGRLERTDGATFSPEDADVALEAIYWTLSFLWGRRTGPTLLVGYSQRGKPVYEDWSVSQLTRWRYVRAWAPVRDPSQLSSLYEGILTKWKSDLWRHTLTQGFHWYVEAQRQAGAVEGSLVLVQVAFEQLWWTVFVGENQVVHLSDVKAADKIRLLLDRHQVPFDIPASLTGLQAKKKADQHWVDGPAAITLLRNTIVHPSKGLKHRPIPEDAPLWETLQLGIWYLEMTLLAVLGYNGPYHPRIPLRGHAMDVKPVPWAAP